MPVHSLLLIFGLIKGNQGLSQLQMMRSLNVVRVKFSNGWGLYGTPLTELLLFLSDSLK